MTEEEIAEALRSGQIELDVLSLSSIHLVLQLSQKLFRSFPDSIGNLKNVQVLFV
jgi:hypothetical protein